MQCIQKVLPSTSEHKKACIRENLQTLKTQISVLCKHAFVDCLDTTSQSVIKFDACDMVAPCAIVHCLDPSFCLTFAVDFCERVDSWIESDLRSIRGGRKFCIQDTPQRLKTEFLLCIRTRFWIGWMLGWKILLDSRIQCCNKVDSRSKDSERFGKCSRITGNLASTAIHESLGLKLLLCPTRT